MTEYTVIRARTSTLEMNRVLRNTYMLLSLTLLFSATTATLAITYNAPIPGPFMTIIGMFGLLFLTQSLRNSPWGLVATFAFTGFMGYTLAPILQFYLHNFTNGGAIITAALGGTGTIFLLLSGFVLVTRKDFSFMGGLLFAGIMIAFIASLLGLFFNMPIFQVAISGVFMLLCSGLILFQTSQILNGGETNYIMATISLYVALFNIFVSLLNILGFFAGGNKN
jgi:modulator of FtsH protease